MRSKKLYITSIYRPKGGRNKDADLEEYFSKVVSVSQEREMGGR